MESAGPDHVEDRTGVSPNVKILPNIEQDTEDSQEERETISIGPHLFHVFTAEDDFNKERKTLFATYIWNGSKTLASYILDEIGVDLLGKSVLEFGAGTGLPSMLCTRLGAQFVCSSNYPSESVLQNLRQNIFYNLNDKNYIQNGEIYSTGVIGYIWGQDVGPMLDMNNAHGRCYDFVLASECLWRHEQHTDLVWSMKNVLKDGGRAIVSHSHHVPGVEDNDDAFFDIATAQGFELLNRRVVPGKHMWRTGDVVDIFVVDLLYRQTN